MKKSKILKQLHGLLREVYKLWLSWVSMFNMFKRPPNKNKSKKNKNNWKLYLSCVLLTVIYLWIVFCMIKVRW